MAETVTALRSGRPDGTLLAALLGGGAIGLVGLLAGRLALRLSAHPRDQLLLAGLLGATLLLGLDLAARGLTAALPSLGLIGALPVGALIIVTSLGVLPARWFGRGRRPEGDLKD